MVYLTEEELILIVVQALIKAKQLRSQLHEGSPKIHIAIQGVRRKKEPTVVFSHEGAHEKHREIAKLKASLAEKHSTHGKAVTSYGAAVLTGRPSPKSHAGGVPLYKKGMLVGSVGISGDAPEVDESIAHAASENFSAPANIRGQVPFLTGSIVQNVQFLPPSSRSSLSPLSRSSLSRSPSKSFENLRRSTSMESLRQSPALKLSPEKMPKSPFMRKTEASGSAAISTLPILPVLAPPTPRSLPPLSNKASLGALPALPPSPVLSSNLPVVRSSPGSLSGLKPLKMSSPLPKLSSSPKLSSPLPKLSSSSSSLKMSSPLPKLSSSSSSLKMSSPLPSSSGMKLKLPSASSVPSPKPLKAKTPLPKLSKLTPLK